jgi:hypothetical protein
MKTLAPNPTFASSTKWMRTGFVSLAAFTLTISHSPFAVAQQRQQPQDWSLVDEGLGRAGTTQPDGVRRYSFPRSDLNVQLDGVTIRPALALGSWVAFQPMGNQQAMVMGDLVLTHEEVNPVMSVLLDGGFTVTALHNHLLRSSPGTMYMHIVGHGARWDLARVIASALGKTATPLGISRSAPERSLGLDTAALDRLIGAAGKSNGGVYQFTIPRPERLTDNGMLVPSTMGTGTVFNFQPLGGGRAATTGDFVLVAREVGPVMRALRAAGIEVAALHNHMLQDEPRLFFMHFWGQADARELARGLRSALDQMGTTSADQSRKR